MGDVTGEGLLAELASMRMKAEAREIQPLISAGNICAALLKVNSCIAFGGLSNRSDKVIS